jgi:hypothetical protein
MDPSPERIARALCWAAAVFALSRWVIQLGRSLWLDEFALAVALKGGFLRAFAYRWQDAFSSMPYYGFMWLWTRFFGMSEIALRLPSFFCMLGCAAVLYALARRWYDSDVALMSTALFVSMREIGLQAMTARPFGLGLLCCGGAAWALDRWARERDLRVLALASAFLAVASLSHPFFLFAGALGALAAVLIAAQSSAPGCRRAAAAFVLPWFAAAPLAIDAARLWKLKNVLPTLKTPFEAAAIFGVPLRVFGSYLYSAPWLAWIIYPPLAVGAGALIARYGLRCVRRVDVQLLSASIVLPALLLGMLSWVVGAPVLFGRYLFIMFPAEALAFALLLRAIPHRLAGPMCCALLSVLLVNDGEQGRIPVTFENWRDATAKLNELWSARRAPVLVNTGYAEADSIPRILDPHASAFLLAPFAYYPIAATPRLMPRAMKAQGVRRFWDSTFRDLRQHGGRSFFLLTRSPLEFECRMLRREAIRRGFRMREVHTVRRIPNVVALFRFTARRN